MIAFNDTRFSETLVLKISIFHANEMDIFIIIYDASSLETVAGIKFTCACL